jgi:hypothetical protein
MEVVGRFRHAGAADHCAQTATTPSASQWNSKWQMGYRTRREAVSADPARSAGEQDAVERFSKDGRPDRIVRAPHNVNDKGMVATKVWE